MDVVARQRLLPRGDYARRDFDLGQSTGPQHLDKKGFSRFVSDEELAAWRPLQRNRSIAP
jgi:hypothetical protein